MALILSEEELHAAGMTRPELRQHIATFLFEQDRLTLGQASVLAGMSQAAFMHLLARHDLSLHYGTEELREDLETIRRFGRPR